MEQSPSLEDNRLSASQEIPRILWNQKVHYGMHKNSPPSLFWATSIQSKPHPTFWRPILILSSHLRLGLLSFIFSSSFPPKPYNHVFMKNFHIISWLVNVYLRVYTCTNFVRWIQQIKFHDFCVLYDKVSSTSIKGDDENN